MGFIKAAINYTHSCETLPDRALNISQEAFINNCQDYFGGKPKQKCFTTEQNMNFKITDYESKN